ncbi:S9 family peptidase [candidate division KSB1 bacterium]|nr:S9 family peptidase [candidate division KSB1 bacterium]
MNKKFIVLATTLLAMATFAQTPYKLPPQTVVDILDAPPTPYTIISPRGDAMLFVEYRPHPAIALLARPLLKLGGLRLDPQRNARQRLSEYTGLSIKWLQPNRTVNIGLPEDARVGIPSWSYDGAKLAFTRDVEAGVELWVADAKSGEARALANMRVNDVLSTAFAWMGDNAHLFVQLIPENRGTAPQPPSVPYGPIVEETAGKFSKVMTFQDLLRNPHDEALFEYYATAQLAVINVETNEVHRIGAPGLIMGASFSPDEKYVLVSKLKKPFSYRVPYSYFTRTVEVWDRAGKLIATIADLPISDEIPTQGVPTGPRSVQWQALQSATLLWVEALDGGDPLRKVEHRDKLMRLTAPFAAAAQEVLKLQHRYAGLNSTARAQEVLLTEYDRDRRWRTTAFVNLIKPEKSRKVIFDLSANDDYNDPGRPVYETRPEGVSVLRQEGDWIFFNARGASPEGERPALDRLNLKTLKKERLFHSSGNAYEQFIAFAGKDNNTIITRYESKTEPPNFFLVNLKKQERTTLTAFKDPAPQLTGLKKELVKYERSDSVQLSGTLYLPPNYQAGEKLPLIIWAYPLEYSDPATAGQVRGSPNTFTFLRGTSVLFFLMQGYAVLLDATMPVVGDPETMNDTFVEQIVGAAQAAIDKLDEMGVIDRKRVCIAGHSYGAFMTANLLAHSDLFAAGIARSGAYNRSLTPFGFQSERRSFWEASDTYMKVSPFTHAHKINEPLLLIHGEADNNSGTHTMQSERLYQAIKGNGGTARLVLLPHESHGYVARESVLHTLAEMFEWAEKYVKNRKTEVGTN